MTHLRGLFLVAPVVVAVCVSCSNEAPAVSAPVESQSEAVSPHDGHAMAAHGNHTPHHGGTVYMKGDLHFEVVLSPDGTHRVYFSDAMRAELPAATASEVTLAFLTGDVPGELLRAEVDGSGESWIVKGPPLKASERTARVSFVVDDEPYWIDVPYVDAGEAALSSTAPAGQ